MKKNWRRKVLGGICLTSAAFVFQACYGVPQDFGKDLLVEGVVKSKKTGNSLNGIKVSVANQIQYTITDAEGKFGFYLPKSDTIHIMFEDVDSTRSIFFASKDSLVGIAEKQIQLTIELEEKDETVSAN